MTWKAPTFNSYLGDEAEGYRVYVSTDGYGFDGGTYVDGAANTSLTVSGLDSSAGVHYFKVAAVNEGGESPATEVVAARPSTSDTRVLIVNGFDRLDRTLNPREPYLSGTIDRVKRRMSNSMDYSVQAGEAVEAYSSTIAVDGSSNESVGLAELPLDNYDAVIWISGEESSADETFDSSEQFWVSNYLNQFGKMFVSGAEVGWDLDNLNNGRSFYEDDLRANYVSDDAGTYDVQSVAGSIFDGLSFSFDDGSLFYDAQFPDVIGPSNGSVPSLSYVGGTGGTAAVQFTGPLGGQIVNFGFPFETITTSANRAGVMERVLDFFELQTSVTGDFDGNGLYECSDVDSLVVAIVDVKNGNAPNTDFDLTGDGNVTDADLDAWLVEAGAAGLTASGNPVQLGDADLSGAVDGQDFLTWNANKFTSSASWCDGDFNADGAVDGQDFLIWNANKFTISDLVRSGTTASETRVPRQAAANPPTFSSTEVISASSPKSVIVALPTIEDHEDDSLKSSRRRVGAINAASGYRCRLHTVE